MKNIFKYLLSFLFILLSFVCNAQTRVDESLHTEEYKDSLICNEYIRQYDSIYNSLVSDEREIEIEKERFRESVFVNFFNESSEESSIESLNKPIEGCEMYDTPEVSSGRGIACGESLSYAKDKAYYYAFQDILFRMDGIYKIIIIEVQIASKPTTLTCENLHSWKKNLFINYKKLSAVESNILVCERYENKNGIFIMDLNINVPRNSLKNQEEIPYTESDFDNLYKTDKRFYNIVSEYLYQIRKEEGYNYILIDYPVKVGDDNRIYRE